MTGMPAYLRSSRAPGRLRYPVELSGTREARDGIKVVREAGYRTQGDRRYHFDRLVAIIGWQATPPPGFLNGNNSITEWWCYQAFRILLGPEGIRWKYQAAAIGGRRIPGGAIIDFELRLGRRIACRVQTYRYHIAVPEWKLLYDREQRIRLENAGYHVVELWEHRILADRAGKGALDTCSMATNGIEYPPPFGAMGNGIRPA